MITNGKWELLDSGPSTAGPRTERLKVPGGWIVRSTIPHGYNAGSAVHQIFIEDEAHEWVIDGQR